MCVTVTSEAPRFRMSHVLRHTSHITRHVNPQLLNVAVSYQRLKNPTFVPKSASTMACSGCCCCCREDHQLTLSRDLLCRVLLERTLKSWGVWHTFNAAAATAAAAAAAAATVIAADAARTKAENAAAKHAISLLSPPKGKLAAKFGNLSSRMSNTPRNSPHSGAAGALEVSKNLGAFTMNDVTIVW